MGARSFWHLTIERPGLSFGDLIWLSQSGRSPPAVRGRRVSSPAMSMYGSAVGQNRALAVLK